MMGRGQAMTGRTGDDREWTDDDRERGQAMTGRGDGR